MSECKCFDEVLGKKNPRNKNFLIFAKFLCYEMPFI